MLKPTLFCNGMINILITGSNGQLGTAIRELSSGYEEFLFTYIDINELDLTNETEVRKYFLQRRFNYIINCAAYTAVDQAEKQPDKAFAVNAGIPQLLASICSDTDTKLIHISSDYVYDGKQSTPHVEEEDLQAVSVYAKTKLSGEKALWDNSKVIIIRTSWLYYESGNNFLKTMIRLSKEREELGVVSDQAGTPTYALDLAETILKIVAFSEINGFKSGIYNYSNEGVCSWFDFAFEIMRFTGSRCLIKPIRTKEYPLPAYRPEYSVLDKNKIKQTFGLTIPYWRDSLFKSVEKLKKNNEL
jgi:dTDP-4-dehydrorhamnose reductase